MRCKMQVIIILTLAVNAHAFTMLHFFQPIFILSKIKKMPQEINLTFLCQIYVPYFLPQNPISTHLTVEHKSG